MNTFVKSLLKCSSVYAMLLLLTSSFVYAEQSIVSKIDDLKPQFSFPITSDEPIIEYTLHHDMLVENDPEPLLQVFGNGRVKVHYPVYMKKAGDYEMTLSPSELRDLITSFSDDGIMEFDANAVRVEKKQIDTQNAQIGPSFNYVSDDTHTTLILRLDSWQKNKSMPSIQNFHKHNVWKNLDHNVNRYPQSTALQSVKSSMQRVKQLMNHSALRRQ